MSCFTRGGGGEFSEMLSCFLDVAPDADKILHKGDVLKFVLNGCEFRENLVGEILIVLKGHKLICMWK